MSSSPFRPRTVTLVVSLLLALLLALPGAGGLYIATRHPGYSCQIEVRAPVGAAMQGEYLLVQDRLSLFPLGLACDYRMQDGSIQTVGPGWSSTGFALASSAFLVIGVFQLLRLAAHRRAVRAGIDVDLWKRS